MQHNVLEFDGFVGVQLKSIENDQIGQTGVRALSWRPHYRNLCIIVLICFDCYLVVVCLIRHM